MAEYIEREAIIETIKTGYLSANEDDYELEAGYAFACGVNGGLNRAIHDISHAPAADVAPVVHGRWILDSDNEYASQYHCDKCGGEIDLCNEIYTEKTPNYCPNCGAKMDLEG